MENEGGGGGAGAGVGAGAGGRSAAVVPHAVLVPWMGQGHIVPMVQLARNLVAAGVHVTMVYGACTHARLRRAQSPELAEAQPHIMRVEVIPDGLPVDDPSFSPTFEDGMAAVPVLQRGLLDLLAKLLAARPRPTCVVSGTFCTPWTAAPAAKLGLPRVDFWSSMAIIYAIPFYMHKLVDAGYIPFKGCREETWISCLPGVPAMRASDYPSLVLPSLGPDFDEKKIQEWCEQLNHMFRIGTEAHTVLVNSIYELEPSTFDALRADHLPALAIGPLILQDLAKPTPDAAPILLQQPSSSMYREDPSCLQWLDSKGAASVVYVAFGSNSTFKREDLLELAFGLEESKHNFLWVIRPGSVLDMAAASSFQNILPEGFLDRTAERGLVVSWAPQKQILAHSATGAFLSHCGWNSTMETLCFGQIPIIAWPQRTDQPTNKKLIEEDWKVGISLKSDGEGRVVRAAIAKAVRDVMQGEEGTLARKTVSEMRELLHKVTQKGGTSRMNLEAFVEDLYQLSQDHHVGA